MKLSCKHCDRYLMTIKSTTIVDEVPCPGCKAKSNYKVVYASSATPEQLRYKSDVPEVEPKKLKENK